MNKRTFLISCLLLSSGTAVFSQTAVVKRRADSFFGVHFDFHAQYADKQIGLTLTPGMINQFLDKVKPDYIQVDAKGHLGIASYPTTVGVPATGIIKDPLRLFRTATLQKGVALYAHFSGIVDAEAVTRHPDWARVNNDNQRDKTATSIFGPYCKQYFIPQIEELSKKYNIDGVWVDGECWAVQPDFSTNARRAYTASTNRPATLNADYMQFTRLSYHRYLANYTTALHNFNPRLQIASNWAYSSYMPGRIDAGVDFLSGDIVDDATKNVNFEARVMAGMNKPWDLMVWGFMSDKNRQGHYWKSARMLQQKGAAIIAQGGGYEVYINQNRDASIPTEAVPILADVANFCKTRQPYCFKTKPVPQIAMVLSGAGHNYDLGTSVAFNQNNGGNDNIKGTLSMLLNSQYAVQVLQDFTLHNNLNKYPLIVVTEWNYLEPAFIKELGNYVYNGGKLLLIGGVTGRLFNKLLPYQTESSNKNPAMLPVKSRSFGKGTVTGIDANISLAYFNAPDDKVRQTVAQIVKRLFPNPLVEIAGSDKIHLSISTNNNATLLHLINTNDYWNELPNNQLQFKLPAANAINVTYTTAKKPKQVILQPNHTPLKFSYYKGQLKFNVPGVDIYSIIEIK